MQTREIAILKVALWWSEAIQKPLNKNNGDDNSILTVLSLKTTIEGQKSITPMRIIAFEDKLVDLLSKIDRDLIILSSDYNPDNVLTDAAIHAGIPLICFPWKSNSSIDENNVATAKMGYGASQIIL